MYFTLAKGRDTEHLTLLLALPPVFSFLNQNSTGSIIFRTVEFNLKLTHPSRMLLLGHSNDVMQSSHNQDLYSTKPIYTHQSLQGSINHKSPHHPFHVACQHMYYESLPLSTHALQMLMGIHSTWTFSLPVCDELILVVKSDFCLPMMKERTFLSGGVLSFFLYRCLPTLNLFIFLCKNDLGLPAWLTDWV